MELENLDQYDKRLDGATDKSQNVKDYIGIMEASRGSLKAKQVAVRLIPKYFKHFPILSISAIDRYVNLCKDEELEVRVPAILGLPQFCQDTPKYIPKLVDVLGQLPPPAGGDLERDAVQISLFTILRLAVENYKMHQEEGDLFDVPPSIVNPADFGKNVDISLTSKLKIGVIDSGFSGTHTLRDLQCFVRPPISKSYHSCEGPAMLSPHGFACASVISGRSRNMKFFGVCDKEIHGVIPDAQLYTYAMGCGNCRRSLGFACDAIKAAMQDGVKVISMSQGLVDPSSVITPRDDIIGMKLLDASDIFLACVAVGNEGPREGTALYGEPWVFTVGSCTGGEILVTDVEIAVATSENIPSDVHILDREGAFYIIDRIQGVSLNVDRSHFCKLRIVDGSEGVESLLYADDKVGIFILAPVQPKMNCKSIIVAPPVTTTIWATIYKEDTHKLASWEKKFSGQLFVRILQSKYQKDERGFFVADFSSRGPSKVYQNNITPDIVAPGYAVLASHLSTIELNYQERIKNPSLKKISNDHTIITGTSLACPLVAAYALIVCSYYPDLKPSAIKSALITTASSFASRGIPGNEFVFGAGAVDLERALNPGLVYEESEFNFRRYVNGDIEIFDLNLPTFAAAFPHSHRFCEKMFPRELKNVGKDDGAYKFEVQFFNKSPSDKVEITAEPDYLKFKPGEKHKFVLKVKICPRPHASVSALVKWVPTSGDRCCVSSPLILYHHTEYNREVVYKVYNLSG